MTSKRIPCPCGKSQDSFAPEYRDGRGYCFRFGCDHKYQKNDNKKGFDTMEGESLQAFPCRGLTKETIQKYNLLTRVLGDEPHSFVFEYGPFQKLRSVKEKSFRVVGTHKPGVYGKQYFDQRGLKSVFICEGEFDAPSIYQMMFMPAVSVQSSGSAEKDCQADFEWINSADRIYLCFDADKPGEEAAEKVARLFDFNKVFKVSLDPVLKDANKYLTENRIAEFKRAVQLAKKFVPDGVISTYEEVFQALNEKTSDPFCTWPIESLEKKLLGIRFGKSYLISGLEGIGKSELVRAVEYTVLKSTDFNIGMIHLEESKRDTIDNLLSYEMGIPLRQASDTFMPPGDKLKAFQELTRVDGRAHIYSHFGSDDPDKIVQIIRYLVAVCGCRVITLDHVNIIVSGLKADADERRLLDYLCTKLASLVVELDFALIMVCHENDDGRPRGSRNISQTAHAHIRLSRDMTNENEYERNKLYCLVAKNRPTSNTGPAGFGMFDVNRGHLVDPNFGKEAFAHESNM